MSDPLMSDQPSLPESLRGPDLPVAVLKRFLALPGSEDARKLLDALLKAGEGSIRIPWLQEQFLKLEQKDCSPMPLVTGDDLTAAGLAPGPLFKRVLDVVYDAQLEDRVSTKEDAMRFALKTAHL